ncbi:MAG: phosphatidate phosphatase App1 family protein [Campylobacteraceae bacterium]
MKLFRIFIAFLTFFGFSLASPLKSDEHVIFIPDIAYLDENNSLQVNIQAWIYEKEWRPGLTTLLVKYIDVDKSKLSKTEYDRLYYMTSLFKIDSEDGKEFKVKFENGQVFDMPKTREGGRSSLLAKLDTKNFLDTQKEKIINFSVFNSTATSADNGVAYYFAPFGYAVISDIDDTIKDSKVLDKKELLRNTFVNEFKAVSGMSDFFKSIKKPNTITSFHYVSSSPIQLYPALQEFIDKNGFPKGSFHLKELTDWDNILFVDSFMYKIVSIRKIINAYPKREFILVGDSGEKDPEIYTQISKEFVGNVARIYIRDVTNEDINSTRFKELTKDLKDTKFTVFKESEVKF